MASKHITLVLDDIDNTEGAETHTFSVNGVNYAIDLNEKNTAKFDKALEPFIEAARRLSGSTNGKSGRNGGRARRGDNIATKVRTWAHENGIEVNERGRVPVELVARYEASLTGESPATPVAEEKPAESAAPAPKPRAPRKAAASKKEPVNA